MAILPLALQSPSEELEAPTQWRQEVTEVVSEDSHEIFGDRSPGAGSGFGCGLLAQLNSIRHHANRVTHGCQEAEIAFAEEVWRLLARDIASATRRRDGVRERWSVDPLTRKVFLHSVTALLHPDERERLREAFAEPLGRYFGPTLSADGQAVLRLLTTLTADEAEAALRGLPTASLQA